MPKRTLSTSRNGDYARLDARDTDGDTLVVRIFRPSSYFSIAVATSGNPDDPISVELDYAQTQRLRDFLNTEFPA